MEKIKKLISLCLIKKVSFRYNPDAKVFACWGRGIDLRVDFIDDGSKSECEKMVKNWRNYANSKRIISH